MRHLTTTTALAGCMAVLAGGALAQTELTMWYHGAGNEVESRIINQIVDDFNASQDDWSVSIESFPQESYNDSVVASALAGNLPCILDVDGPVMPNWAWSGYMQPLDIDESRIADFLPGTKGIWDGQLYSIGLWDAAVAMTDPRPSTLDEQRQSGPPTIRTAVDGRGPNSWRAPRYASKGRPGNSNTRSMSGWPPPGDRWNGIPMPLFAPFLQESLRRPKPSWDGSTYGPLRPRSRVPLNGGPPPLAPFGEWWPNTLFVEGPLTRPRPTSQSPPDRDNGFGRRQSMPIPPTSGGQTGGCPAERPLTQFRSDTIFSGPNVDFGNGPGDSGPGRGGSWPVSGRPPRGHLRGTPEGGECLLIAFAACRVRITWRGLPRNGVRGPLFDPRPDPRGAPPSARDDRELCRGAGRDGRAPFSYEAFCRNRGKSAGFRGPPVDTPRLRRSPPRKGPFPGEKGGPLGPRDIANGGPPGRGPPDTLDAAPVDEIGRPTSTPQTRALRPHP